MARMQAGTPLKTIILLSSQEPLLFFALLYRYSYTEITPVICRDGFRNVILAVRAEACGRFCRSVLLAEALAEAPGAPA